MCVHHGSRPGRRQLGEPRAAGAGIEDPERFAGQRLVDLAIATRPTADVG
jgi:hypothetical protein